MRLLALFLGALLNIILFLGMEEIGGWHPLQTMTMQAVLNFFAILFHELGHAWAYRHVGGQVHKIAVMFALYDVDHRRFGWSDLSADGDVGGYVQGSFDAHGPSVRHRIIVSAAGPAANLITGAAAACAAWLWTKPQLGLVANVTNLPSDDKMRLIMASVDSHFRALWWWQQGHTSLVLFALLSVGFTLLNLIPFGGSDGQRIMQTWQAHRGRRGVG